MKALSILIPTFNDECVTLVKDLREQTELLGIDYEILVGDDGSTDARVVHNNRAINLWPHCQFLECSVNEGRSAIRNFLAQQAHFHWLLFIDSDMVVRKQDFIALYAKTQAPVVDGGVTIGHVIPGNLRSMYEKAVEQQHTAERRQLSPYQDFHTANFLVRRDIMLAHPFDQRFHEYGYEDVLFGKVLQQHGIPIQHINNPLSFEIYEQNAEFVRKTEEGLRTLYRFRDELQGYSRILAWAEKVPHLPLRLCHRLFVSWERRNLVGRHPQLWIFKLYKLGYYLSLS